MSNMAEPLRWIVCTKSSVVRQVYNWGKVPMTDDLIENNVWDTPQTPITDQMINDGVKAWMDWNERADYAPERLVAEVYLAMSHASRGPSSRCGETSRLVLQRADKGQ